MKNPDPEVSRRSVLSRSLVAIPVIGGALLTAMLSSCTPARNTARRTSRRTTRRVDRRHDAF